MITPWEALVAQGMEAGLAAGKMFGAEALLLDGKAVVCAKKGMVGFKLGEGSPAHARALSLVDAELFDPSGKHRPFRDWVAIPVDRAEDVCDLLGLAIERAANSASSSTGR